MSRKDYEAFAASLAQVREQTADILGSYYVLHLAADRIADVLALDNPRFDRGRFLQAAGFPGISYADAEALSTKED